MSTGRLVPHGEAKSSDDLRPQHAGFGRRLIQAAEIVAMANGMSLTSTSVLKCMWGSRSSCRFTTFFTGQNMYTSLCVDTHTCMFAFV